MAVPRGGERARPRCPSLVGRARGHKGRAATTAQPVEANAPRCYAGRRRFTPQCRGLAMHAQDPAPASPERQLRRACLELDRRLRAGETARAEDWLQALHAVKDDPEL